jgi:hypothetical protein
VHATLRARAAAAGVSLSDYLLGELTRVAERPAVADLLARSQARGRGAPRQAVVDAVRAGRHRA